MAEHAPMSEHAAWSEHPLRPEHPGRPKGPVDHPGGHHGTTAQRTLKSLLMFEHAHLMPLVSQLVAHHPALLSGNTAFESHDAATVWTGIKMHDGIRSFQVPGSQFQGFHVPVACYWGSLFLVASSGSSNRGAKPGQKPRA
jgi:hypothetical protein